MGQCCSGLCGESKPPVSPGAPVTEQRNAPSNRRSKPPPRRSGQQSNPTNANSTAYQKQMSLDNSKTSASQSEGKIKQAKAVKGSNLENAKVATQSNKVNGMMQDKVFKSMAQQGAQKVKYKHVKDSNYTTDQNFVLSSSKNGSAQTMVPNLKTAALVSSSNLLSKEGQSNLDVSLSKVFDSNKYNEPSEED